MKECLLLVFANKRDLPGGGLNGVSHGRSLSHPRARTHSKWKSLGSLAYTTCVIPRSCTRLAREHPSSLKFDSARTVILSWPLSSRPVHHYYLFQDGKNII
ncbi:hypothetical protein SCLCIDRAFT_586418 [Scleroderma citrinum Foug A]|uniref:Uncharacterized protein n=1 Tax=Scleroderma citrinum Foug A TaxID=1036808 RepID=A0A0C3EAR0_9AGAM|nr:hypothetical protein SCLCIDRAFT_586418 [Scleroderma citrinum Foug A]